MRQFLDLVRLIHTTGNFKADRTGTGTYSIFGHQMRFDLSEGFPLVTAKHTHLKSIIHELLWFLQGETNIRYLKANGVRIWDEWVKEGTAEYIDLSLEERWSIYNKDLDAWQEYINREATNNELMGLYPNVARHLRIGTDDEQHAILDTHRIGAWKHSVDENKGAPIPRQRLIAGELGPVYGSQWRSWPGLPEFIRWADMTNEDNVAIIREEEDGAVVQHRIDQIKNLIEMIKRNPDSRRMIVSAWNPAEVDNMALPPCHTMFQFYSNFLSMDELEDVIGKAGKKSEYLASTRGKDLETDDEFYDHALLFCQEHDLPRRKLSCQLYQRSADVFLGVPFNIASYALLTMMIAQVTNHVAGEFIWTGGDCHLYSNHAEQVELLLTRKTHVLPTMKINPEVKDIFGFKFEDFELQNYVSEPAIAAQVAV